MDLFRGSDTAVLLAKALLFAIVFCVGCNQPQKVITPSTNDTASITGTPLTVKEPAKKKKKKKVYLTFDDGPNKGTRNVLDIVQDEQIPVSFFIVGEHVFASKAQAEMWGNLKLAADVDLCNHSYSHAHGAYANYYNSPSQVVADFERTRDSLHLSNFISRTPGRNIWRLDSLQFTDLKSSKVAADSLQQAGFVLMGWDLEWQYDHKTFNVLSSADHMIAEIDSAFSKQQTRTPDHLVLLAHDQVYGKSDDSIQLRQFLQRLKARDEYEIALVSDYPGTRRTFRPDTIKLRTVLP